MYIIYIEVLIPFSNKNKTSCLKKKRKKISPPTDLLKLVYSLLWNKHIRRLKPARQMLNKKLQRLSITVMLDNILKLLNEHPLSLRQQQLIIPQQNPKSLRIRQPSQFPDPMVLLNTFNEQQLLNELIESSLWSLTNLQLVLVNRLEQFQQNVKFPNHLAHVFDRQLLLLNAAKNVGHLRMGAAYYFLEARYGRHCLVRYLLASRLENVQVGGELADLRDF